MFCHSFLFRINRQVSSKHSRLVCICRWMPDFPDARKQKGPFFTLASSVPGWATHIWSQRPVILRPKAPRPIEQGTGHRRKTLWCPLKENPAQTNKNTHTHTPTYTTGGMPQTQQPLSSRPCIFWLRPSHGTFVWL